MYMVVPMQDKAHLCSVHIHVHIELHLLLQLVSDKVSFEYDPWQE